MTIPKAIRAFHLPTKRGAFANGELRISGLGRVLFPKSPTKVVVRSLPLHGDRVEWLRCFGGRQFLQSTFSHGTPISTSRSKEKGDGRCLHNVEYVFPFEFHFDWRLNQTGSQNATTIVAPRHVSTSLLGLVPLPRTLVSVDMTLLPHTDGGGWDLSMTLSALKGRLQLIGYAGPLRLLRTSDNGVGGAGFIPGFHHLVLFDGHCNLCNASVDFIIRFDPLRKFMFCAQQSPQATELLELLGHAAALKTDSSTSSEDTSTPPENHTTDDDSVLLLTPDGVLHKRAAAALRSGAALAWPWSWLARVGLAAERLLPKGALDRPYRWVGANRYRWFGRKETCRLPTPEERARFL